MATLPARRFQSNAQRLKNIRNSSPLGWWKQRLTPSDNINDIITQSYFPLTQALVAWDTTSSNDPRINRSTVGISNLVERTAKALGIETEVVPVINEYGHHAVIICRVGPKKGGILMTGHVDTVPADDEKQLAVSVEGDKIYGRGVVDMKGSVAAMLAILGLMKQHEHELKEEFVFALTPGEETWLGGAEAARQALDKLGIKPRLVVIPEADAPDAIHSGHPGFAALDVTTPSAVHALADLISNIDQFAEEMKNGQEWRREGFTPPYPTLNQYIYPTAARNIVPAEAWLDVVADTPAAIQALENIVQEAAKCKLQKKGQGQFELYIEGVACHSDDPSKGVNAWSRWAEIVHALQDVPDLHLSLDKERHGENITWGISYRGYVGQDDAICKHIADVVATSFKQNGLQSPTVKPMENAPPMPVQGLDSPEVKAFAEIVGEIISAPVRRITGNGWGDGASFVNLSNHPPVVYWFPHAEGTHHKPDEYITFRDYINGFKGLLGIAADICGVETLKNLARQTVTVGAEQLQPVHTLER